LSARGEFLGGAIAPGMSTSAAALFESTAQLRRVELVAPPTVIGRTTVTSIQSGVVYGTAALVDGLVERVSDELSGEVGVVATGGLAPAVVDHCRRVERLEPALTLLGLRLVFERNTAMEEA
jgi:type III pantothenate kinase